MLERAAPGHSDAPENGASEEGLAGVQRFLYAIATAALKGSSVHDAGTTAPDTPLPLRARAFLLSLRDAAFASTAALSGGLDALAEVPAAVSRSGRGIQIGASGFMPIGVAVIAIVGILFMGATGRTGSVMTLGALMNELEAIEKAGASDPATQQKRDDIEIYLAEHMARVIQDPATWDRSSAVKITGRGERERAQAVLERRRTRSPEEVRRAEATVAPILATQNRMLGKMSNLRGLTGIFTAALGGSFMAVAFFAFAGALATGSGFTFRPFGIALVNRRGQPISRVRALWRATVTWIPIVGVALAFKFGPDVMNAGYAVLALHLALNGVLIGGAIWAWLHPSRGIQDRVAGTWIVPR
jgi:hypothetical protein